MGRIKQLAPNEIIKIAAGEVVERPGNIVKELIENALDAGAGTVRIQLEDGGRTTICVIDDGCGMDKDDAILSFSHHATSKLESVDQLTQLNSFGFRGEALSSIASVAHVELITRKKDDDIGTKVIIHNGTIEPVAPHAAPPGTSIHVSQLFENVPARKKFLRSKDTELRAIQQLVHAYAMAHCGTTFTLEHNQKVLLQATKTTSLIDRLAQLKDHTIARNCITLIPETISDGSRVSGIISNHQTYRYDRSLIFCFVNGRWIKNYQLANACIRGYGNVLPHGRYPAAMLFLNVPCPLVDINVHPRKEEVQFAHPHRIRSLIVGQVQSTLDQHVRTLLEPQQSPSLQHTSNIAPRSSYSMPSTAIPPLTPLAHSQRSVASDKGPFPITAQKNHVAQDLPQAQQQATVSAEKPTRIIGQLLKTYILIEQYENLILVDQHAAHERILYEQFTGTFEQAASVQLIFAQPIQLDAETINVIEPYLPIITSCGLTLEISGVDSFILRSRPVHSERLDVADLLLHMASAIKKYAQLDTQQLRKKISWHVHSHMACKAAVRAGMELEHKQMLDLVTQLFTCPHHLTCPHGRPTIWTITRSEIERFFKRT